MKDIIYIRIGKHCRYGHRLKIRSCSLRIAPCSALLSISTSYAKRETTYSTQVTGRLRIRRSLALTIQSFPSNQLKAIAMCLPMLESLQ
jgi:hypothetical protein